MFNEVLLFCYRILTDAMQSVYLSCMSQADKLANDLMFLRRWYWCVGGSESLVTAPCVAGEPDKHVFLGRDNSGWRILMVAADSCYHRCRRVLAVVYLDVVAVDFGKENREIELHSLHVGTRAHTQLTTTGQYRVAMDSVDSLLWRRSTGSRIVITVRGFWRDVRQASVSWCQCALLGFDSRKSSYGITGSKTARYRGLEWHPTTCGQSVAIFYIHRENTDIS